jgi:2-polyprenyl-3-methyl-5-hydroxy-6-metoxy-1,4-benzoquinol methylase
MKSVEDHYASHLGPVYAWAAGGPASAIERGAAELDDLDLEPSLGAVAVDLGAGFGMHAIPLARLGYTVLAVDSCTALLDALRRRTGPLPVRAVEDDMLEFRRHLPGVPEVIVCMGDTITHLEHPEAVLELVSEAASALPEGGRFVLTFRDYSTALTAEKRFIPVRSDENRILTCFLEFAEHHVTVHDLLHEREAHGWSTRVSSYRKLRLDPAWLVGNVEARGFEVRRDAGPSGMVRLVATRCGGVTTDEVRDRDEVA